MHFCGCPRPRSKTSKVTSILPRIYKMTVSQLTVNGSDPTPLTIPPITPSSLNFLESVEAAHSSHSFNDRVSTLLGIMRPPIRVDSQAKYCCLARGDAGAYLRMPTGVGYREKIWVGFFTTYLLLCLAFVKVLLCFVGPRTWPDPCGRSWWNSDRFQRTTFRLWTRPYTRRKFWCNRRG